MNDSPDMRHKRKPYRTWVENALLFILILSAIIYAGVFSIGQIYANKTILDLEQTLQQAVSDGNVSLVEYDAAIKYMELSQQAYNASTTTNMTSILYGLVTAVILGYGVNMLQKLHSLKTELETMSEQMTSRFDQQDEVYTATTSCHNAAHTCSLIQSYIAFLEQERRDISNIPDDNFIFDLEAYFIRSLEKFSYLVEKYSSKAFDLTKTTFNALDNSWGIAEKTIRTYLSNISLYEKVFGTEGGEQETIQMLYDKINDGFQQIKEQRRAQE